MSVIMSWTLILLSPVLTVGQSFQSRRDCVTEARRYYRGHPGNQAMCVGGDGKYLNAQTTKINPTDDESSDRRK